MSMAFMMSTAVVRANQCSSGHVCHSDNEPQNAVLLLQTKLQMNALTYGDAGPKHDVLPLQMDPKMNVLKHGGDDSIAELKAQEKSAIAREDFIGAQRIKLEIEALPAQAGTLGASHGTEGFDVKETRHVGHVLQTKQPSEILAELEQKVSSGVKPAFDVLFEIRTLIMDHIMPDLESLRDQAAEYATGLTTLINSCNDGSSDLHLNTTQQAVSAARSSHVTCRDVQQTEFDFNLTHPDSYCAKLGKLLHDTLPLSSPGSSTRPRATSVQSVASAIHTIPSCNSDVLQLDANCTEQETGLRNKDQQCSDLQERFEFRFCEWKDEVESKCKTLDRCYSTTMGLYNNHAAKTEISWRKWDDENATLQKILCYCDVWLHEKDEEDNRSQHNTTHFQVCNRQTHTPEPLNLNSPPAKVDCLLPSVANDPGTQGFIDQEYSSFLDFVAPVIPCMQPSTMEPPTTEAPTMKAPTTKVPTTKVPTTEAPTTEVPTTESPSTEAPATKAPTTQALTTEAPEAPTTTEEEDAEEAEEEDVEEADAEEATLVPTTEEPPVF